MDINPSYNCLLGRPWIHMVGAVPSTLHQKVKFVIGESLINVATKKDMVAMTTVTTPYVEVEEDAIECSFKSFEVATATYAKDELEMPVPHLSQNTWMSLKSTIKKGAKIGYGLGRNLQVINRVISIAPKHDRHGLGYQFDNRERNG